jgi:tripartite ATP-independent transporter DctM subunit
MLGTTFLLLIALLALAIPVAAALGVLGLILERLYSTMPLSLAMGEVAWSASRDFLLVSIPMFILLGEILLRSGVAERMYAALSKWLSWLPGGLMHSNIGACAVFAATSGSSVATAATVGTVALPLVRTHGYNERLFLGTLAAGGTLGILIPPSINMIIYAVLTDTSIPKLYLAGIIPGLSLAGLFMLIVAVACTLRPEWGGTRLRASWTERLGSLPQLLPPLFIFLVVVGSIYAGLATPTEAASLGVVAALGLAPSTAG